MRPRTAPAGYPPGSRAGGAGSPPAQRCRQARAAVPRQPAEYRGYCRVDESDAISVYAASSLLSYQTCLELGTPPTDVVLEGQVLSPGTCGDGGWTPVGSPRFPAGPVL